MDQTIMNHTQQLSTGGFLNQVFAAMRMRYVPGNLQDQVETGQCGYCIDAPQHMPAGSAKQWNEMLGMAHSSIVTR